MLVPNWLVSTALIFFLVNFCLFYVKILVINILNVKLTLLFGEKKTKRGKKRQKIK